MDRRSNTGGIAVRGGVGLGVIIGVIIGGNLGKYYYKATRATGTEEAVTVAESIIEDPVVRIRTVQSHESAQISFLLKSKVDDFEIETSNDKISILLRTAMAENANKINNAKQRMKSQDHKSIYITKAHKANHAQ